MTARRRGLWIGAAVLLAILMGANGASMLWRWGRPYLARDPLAGYPRVFLWAWERPLFQGRLCPAARQIREHAVGQADALLV